VRRAGANKSNALQHANSRQVQGRLPLTAKNANGTVAQIYAEVRKRWA